jgi:nitrite reductase/ring-hydroxylating ferredoxin subunit
MSRRTHVCSLQELPPGEMKLVPVGKFGVGVYNVGGRLHAITNYCAHEGAPLCQGYTVGMNVVDPDAIGKMRRIRDGEILRCPWHRWEYDLASGKLLFDPRRGIRIYEVDVDDGEVYLNT